MATKPNKNIKVSQATIDKIKKQGMTASLKSASSNNSPEYREALRRMYGDARVAKATASTKPSSSGRYVGSIFVPDKPAKATPSGGKYVGSMFVPDKPAKPSAKATPTGCQPSGYRNPSQAKTTTIWNPRTGEKVTYPTPKPKPKPKPKAKAPALKYNPYTREKL